MKITAVRGGSYRIGGQRLKKGQSINVSPKDITSRIQREIAKGRLSVTTDSVEITSKLVTETAKTVDVKNDSKTTKAVDTISVSKEETPAPEVENKENTVVEEPVKPKIRRRRKKQETPSEE